MDSFTIITKDEPAPSNHVWFKICIQAGIYKESINNWRKWRLIYKNNNENSFTWGKAKQLNTETIFARYIDVVLTYGESIHRCTKDSAFGIVCDFLEIDIKVSKVVMCVKLFQQTSRCFFSDA